MASSAWADVEFLWAVQGAGQKVPSSLYAINPNNGQVLGLIGSCNAQTVSGLSKNPLNGVLYATQGQSVVPRSLLTINKTTGAATVIGSTTDGIMDTAFASDGTLFGWDASTSKLVKINLTTGALTNVGSNFSTFRPAGITFALDGTLVVVTNQGTTHAETFTADKTTGNKITGPLNSPVTQMHNMLATSRTGRLYGGSRVSGATDLYIVNYISGVMTFVGKVPLSLDGFTFDTAAPPTMAVAGKKKVKTTKSKITLKGTAASLLPLTVSAKGKSAIVAAGSWKLAVKLKKGKNKLTLVCADGMGQSVVTKVTVTRS
jgi:hypothetical protein